MTHQAAGGRKYYGPQRGRCQPPITSAVTRLTSRLRRTQTEGAAGGRAEEAEEGGGVWGISEFTHLRNLTVFSRKNHTHLHTYSLSLHLYTHTHINTQVRMHTSYILGLTDADEHSLGLCASVMVYEVLSISRMV